MTAKASCLQSSKDSDAQDKWIVLKTIKPGSIYAIWRNNEWFDYELVTALVHLIDPDQKVIVPIGWLPNMLKDNWWTSHKTYLCYYNATAAVNGKKIPSENVPHSKVFHKNVWRVYNAHVLEWYGKLFFFIFAIPLQSIFFKQSAPR